MITDPPEAPPEISAPDMAARVLDAYRQGRPVAAALGLARLRERFEDPGAWAAFADRHLVPGLGAERVNELIGVMVHRNGILRCASCGTLARAACACGTPYMLDPRWAVTETVTEKPRRGRPRSNAAMTGTERVRKHRERKRGGKTSAPSVR